MKAPVQTAPTKGWAVWGRPMVVLLLIIFSPLLLLPTPLHRLGGEILVTMLLLLLMLLWAMGMSLLIGHVFDHPPETLNWVEQRIYLWVAWFAADPVPLWLQWARQAYRPNMARWCLEQAIRNGSAEGMLHLGLVYLGGGFGAGGQGAAMLWLRRAAEKGQSEAAFRLAEGLRTRLGNVEPEPAEAEKWYQRSASLGFGPAAEWLSHAYACGDGVVQDEEKARRWSEVVTRLRPFPEPSRSVLRHDAAQDDPLARLPGHVHQHLETAGDRLIAHRAGRWALLVGLVLLAAMALFTVGAFFWAGSSGLHHLPLLMLLPPVLLLAWQAYHLQKDRPRSGRDRLLEAAEAGDPEACYALGVAYREGSAARPRDSLTAALWFRKAAEAGHPLAMIALAEAYLGGHGVLRDSREASRWAEAARHESTSEPGRPIKPGG